MKTVVLDNSCDKELNRVILWQYDNAEKLVAFIEMLKDLFNKSTKEFWEKRADSIAIGDPDKCDAFGLAVWGKILNTPRPTLTYNEESHSMSDELYRKILVAKVRLLNKDATVKNYIDFVKYIFDGNVQVNDGHDMSLSFSIKTGATLTDEEEAALTQASDIIFPYPAGVKSNTHSDSLMFGLSVDGDEPQDPVLTGGLDESGFNWRLTKKGNWK